MQAMEIIMIAVLIVSAVLHEFSHGYAAYLLGDPTAEMEGRLSLNPLVHLDPIGSVLLPLMLVLTGSPFVLGWAKPVPFNPYNFKNRRWGELIVAIAGPASNLILVFIFGFLLRFLELSQPMTEVFSIIVFINIILIIFNMIPIPPLDGSKVLFNILPHTQKTQEFRARLERYGLFIFIFFILFLWDDVSPLVYWLFDMVVG
jgi:Zn-dependent protease